jgi:hypothetical protein
MRSLAIFLLATCGWAAAQQQATVVQGYASTLAPSALVTGPCVPLVNTPEVSLDQPSLRIGASNATEGLIAGATSATGSTNQEQERFASETGGEMDTGKTTSGGFDSGGLNQPESGVASLITAKATPAQPVRTVTNDDVENLNQQTGTVKYGGKTEELR